MLYHFLCHNKRKQTRKIMENKKIYKIIFSLSVFILVSVLLFSFVRYFYLQSHHLNILQSGKHDFEQVESKLKDIITTINRESKVLILLGKLDKTDNELQLNQKDIDKLFNHYPYILGIEKILKLHKTNDTLNESIQSRPGADPTNLNVADTSYFSQVDQTNLISDVILFNVISKSQHYQIKISTSSIMKTLSAEISKPLIFKIHLLSYQYEPIGNKVYSKSELHEVKDYFTNEALQTTSVNHYIQKRANFSDKLPYNSNNPQWVYGIMIDMDLANQQFEKMTFPFVFVFSLFLLVGSICLYRILDSIEKSKVADNKIIYLDLIIKSLISKLPIGIVISIEEKLLFSNSLIQKQLLGLENQHYLIDDKQSKDSFTYAYQTNEFEVQKYQVPYQNEKATIQLVYGAESEVITEHLLKASLKLKHGGQFRNKHFKNLNHNLRTPLHSIMGMAYFLLDSELSTENKESVQTIEDMGQLIIDNLDDLLEYDALDNGKSKQKMKVFDINELVNHLKAIQVPKAESKRLKVVFNLQNNLPNLIISDKGKLRQILNELISNSIKYTREGQIEISIKPYNGKVRFEIKDTGKGIDPDRLQSIKKSIMRLKPQNKYEQSYLNLGLKVVQYYCSVLDSHLEITSNINTGSVFYFDIPFLEPRANEVGQFIKNNTSEIAIEINPHVKILIAEDNKLNALVAAKLLNKIGIENIDFATNGREVIQKIHDVDYDLILMDCQMPIYDGYEATKELRSLGIRTPIIALTASVSDEDVEECFNAGMNNHLSKPIQINQLQEVVNKYLM